MNTKTKKSDKIILFIGALKLVKGVLLLALAGVAFGLMNDALSADLQTWIKQINADAHVRYLETFLNKLSSTSDTQYVRLGISLLVYAALFFAEGIGLLLRKPWGEWLTVIITGSFLPLEIYELTKKFTAVKLTVLILNAAIVVYLIWRLWRDHKKKR